MEMRQDGSEPPDLALNRLNRLKRAKTRETRRFSHRAFLDKY